MEDRKGVEVAPDLSPDIHPPAINLGREPRVLHFGISAGAMKRHYREWLDLWGGIVR